MNALTATDALLFVDHTNTVLVVADGIDRTRLTARTYEMGNGTVRTGLCTHTTLLTLVRIDMRSRLTHRDRAEMTAVLAGLAETETTVICDGIGCKRALLTGRIDDLDRVRVRLRRIRIRILAAGEPDSPLKNLSFLIDAATPGRTRTRRNFHRELLLRFFI